MNLQMDLKVLIICIGFCGLLYGTTGSSEDAPNPNSISNNADFEKGSEQHFEVRAAVRTQTSTPPGAKKETEPTNHEEVIHGRVGQLEVSRDSPSSLDITWIIPNFFNLPYELDKGILSPDFATLGFKGFFVMDPKGSAITPGFLQFRSVVFRLDVRRGEINFRLFLKKADGKFVEFTVKEQFRNFYTCDIPKHKISDEKDIMAPGGALTVLFMLTAGREIPDSSENSSEDAPSSKSRESKKDFEVHAVVREPKRTESTQSGAPKDAHHTNRDISTSNQHMADGRTGELEVSEDTPTSVDVTWKIPNFLTRTNRAEAGIISPDFTSQGFKGYFHVDPQGSTNTLGVISFKSLIFRRDNLGGVTYLQVFLRAIDGTLKEYKANVTFGNYFTCHVSKLDSVDKESLVPGGVLTVLFRLSKEDRGINRNLEETPSLASMYDVGDLLARPESPSKSVVTWKFKDFFSLPEYRQLTGSFHEISPYFFFHIYMTPKGIYNEAGLTRLQVNWRYRGDVPPRILVHYPKFSCKFSLKSGENTLYNISGERYGVAKFGGHCRCFIPWSEIFERKDFLVPGDELTLVLKIDSELEVDPFIVPETQTETQPSNHKDVIDRRIGELEVSRDAPSSLDITWTIPNFFTLPYQPDAGIGSPDFTTLGFKGFFVMDPKGSAITPGVLQFRSVVFRHDVRRGKIHFRLFLKKANGKFVEFTVKEEIRNYYTCDIPKHKIFDEKDIMAPGGVLTVLFRLTAGREIADSSEKDYTLEADKKKLKDCDSKIYFLEAVSSDLLRLYKSGEHSDVTLMCGDEQFPAHKSILSARSSAFAKMFERDTIEDKKRVVDITDIHCPILDLLLQYVYSGDANIDHLPSDKQLQLKNAADKYGIQSVHRR